MATHVGLVPPIPGHSQTCLQSLKPLKVKVQGGLLRDSREARKIQDDVAQRKTEERVGVTSVTKQAVLSLQIFKRLVPAATPLTAPRELPTAHQFHKPSDLERVLQYEMVLESIEQAIAEIPTKGDKVGDARIGSSPLTERNKELLDAQYVRGQLDQYSNQEDIEKWQKRVSESDITQMRYWQPAHTIILRKT